MKSHILIIALICYTGSFLNAQSDYWSDISESQVELVGERFIIPDNYRNVNLNLNDLRILLRSAPMEFTSEAFEGKSLIILPMPDGTFQKFKFWESPAMEPELQGMFPEIRTYTGQGIDDPYSSLKFDFTPHGFHAQILSPNGRVFIDPHNQGNISHYISYFTKDFKKAAPFFECEFNEFTIAEPDYPLDFLMTPTGPQLRTYRLANAATGEYTIFHGGTVTLGLAAVTTSVNRVNGVYEKETAVRMILVANNNLIIYTNPSTDPYSNGSGGTMLGQNQSNLDAVIGNSNYDIGHVFSTGGGGIAGLGVVCVAGQKAWGVTGSSQPIGDPFDIDYVAHEMGHQFGANHTFNGNAGSCSGNRNASTAYEPGSGSTIMAYAGICGAQDLQSNSDAYFHVVSFDEIVAFTNSGSGSSCPVITNTGNNAPVVTVPAGGFNIPISTPFSLTGSATDPNSDPLTYCWEEFDLGPAGAPNSPSGNAPIFRSFTAVTSPTRTFPKLSNLLNNTQTIGEILPTYGRTLTFRMTVRDNRAGGGGVDWKQLAFTVSALAGPFLVTSPNTSVSWTGNTQQTVTWNVANTNASPVNCSTVEILLSTNGGNNFSTVILASTPNDGSEIVTIPNLPTSQARIKVEAVGNIFFDISNANFTIVNNPIIDPGSFIATTISSSQIDLSFTSNPSNNNVVIVWNLTGTFTTPAGTPPPVGSSFAGGTLLFNGNISPVNHTGLSPATTYYYKAFSFNGTSYSPGLTTNATTLVITDFTVSLAVFDNCTAPAPLIFGTASIATDCFDPGLDVLAPPPPPLGAFDSRFVSCNEGLFTDIKATNTNTERIWDVHYQPAEGCFPVSLSWNPAQLPADGYFHLVDPFLGTLVNVNMRTTNSFTDLADLRHLQIKYNYQFCSNFNISSGWNLVSLPVEVTNNNYLTLFPNATPGTLYGYSTGGYYSTETISNCTGYWLKFAASQFVPVCGSDRIDCVVNLNAGWNIIGGPNCNVPLSTVADPGGIIIPGTLYGYSGGYLPSNSIDATKAYWVKTTASGTITISCGSLLAKPENEIIISSEILDEFSRIDISDASENNQTLYFNGEMKNNLTSENFSLPPLPPQGSFDARLIGDYRLTESEEVTILIQASEFPLSINLSNINFEEGYVIQEIANGVEVKTHKIEDGVRIEIDNEKVSMLKITKQQTSLPTSFNLEQNYPNPFNPSTTIKFSLPEDVNTVKLTIYNTLGERIAELVNGNLTAGKYSYQWDASSSASGIYFYELRTDKFVSLKKMILLK